jgi:hypothetical protein
MTPNLAMTKRCAACMELLQAYIQTGNHYIDLKSRSAVVPAQSASALLQSARRRKSAARRRLLLQQGPACSSCPNRVRPA